ncbi:MAG: TolC family protein [Candidatus Binatia bacterium]
MPVDGKCCDLHAQRVVGQRSWRRLWAVFASVGKRSLLMWGCLVVLLLTSRGWAENEESGATTETSAVQTLTIEEAYRQAVANEEQIKIAERELAKAQLLPWRAIALLTPRADVAGVFTRNKEEITFSGLPTGGTPGGEGGGTTTFPSVIRPLESWVGTFSVTQPLIQPSFIPSWQLGKDTIRQNMQRYGFTLREVLFGVARAYYEVLRAQAQVEVAKETLLLTQDELKQAQARFRVGEVTKTDVLRAEVEVARAERAVITSGNNVQLTATVLARAVGVRGTVRVVEPTPPSFPGERYEQLLDKAYKQRQDLRAQDAAIDVAKQRRNLQRARYFPSVGAQWQFPKLDSPTFANRDEFWTLTLNFQVPIFDGGVRELDLQEEEENLSQARFQLDRLKKDVGVEVKQTLLAAETLAATLDTLKKEVALAQENYNITSKQYRVGLATSLDVNTALNALNQVRTQLTDQTYAYQLALLGLDRATGAFAQEYVSQR